MLRIGSTLLMVIAATSLAFAQNEVSKTSSSAADQDVIWKLEQEWAAALVKVDMAVINRITSPEWTLTTPEGRVVPKAETDRALLAGDVKFMSFKIDELKVRVYGHVAIVHGLETEKSSSFGEAGSGRYRFTDVFIKEGGQWKCYATHTSKVAD
jgi:ketosteroid isomerase-like protein